MSDEKSYAVNHPLKRDGKLIKPPGTVVMAEGDANPLLANGTLSPSAAAAPADATEKSSSEFDKVIEAIDALEEGNDDHWTKDGKPDAKALSDRAGFTVSAELRDTAWAQVGR